MYTLVYYKIQKNINFLKFIFHESWRKIYKDLIQWEIKFKYQVWSFKLRIFQTTTY